MAASATPTATATSAVSSAVQTFAGLSLGTARAGRQIVVAAQAKRGSAATLTASATIGGVAATEVVATTQTDGSHLGLYVATVPTGATGDVVVTYSLGVGRASVAVYDLDGDTAVADFDSYTASSTTDPTNTLDVPANGVVISAVMATLNTSATWTNADEDYDAFNSTYFYSSAHKAYATTQTGLVVTADILSTTSASRLMVSASWGPPAAGGIVPLLLHRAFMTGGA